MLDKIQKKIRRFYTQLFNFFKAYLAHIVFLVFTLQLLSFTSNLPYFNLVNKYYYYVFALLWIFSNFLFKRYITNRLILIFGIAMFFLAIPPALIELEFLTDIFGFAAFVLLFTYIARQIFVERKNLRNV